MISTLPSLKKTIFYGVFLLVFCFGFLLTVLSRFSFRLAPVSLLAIPLLFFYGLKSTRVLVAYVILAVIVIASGMYNNSSLINILLFLRILIFSYLIYYLTNVSITSEWIVPLIKVCVWVAVIQLPVILLQWQLYASLPLRWRGSAALVDFGSGTFNYKTDYAMAFFLTLMIIFLLLERKRNYIIKYRLIITFWLTLTVLVSNSQLMKIAVLLVWLAYFVINFRVQKMFVVGFGTLMVGLSVLYFSSNNLVTEDITTFFARITDSSEDVNTYLSGGYSRTAAIKYFASEDGFTWLGAGPTAFSDPFTRTLLRGNTGHFFTFFSEIGFLGWFASLVVLFLISFPTKNNKMQVSWMNFLIFMAILLLSFTAQVMNDIAVFFIYCIMLRISLIPMQQENEIVHIIKEKS